MKIYEDERTNNWVFKQMRDRLEREDRTGDPWHASELFGCPRKALLNREKPPTLTREDILYFIRGYAIQEYIFGAEDDGELHLGVILSPDHIHGDHIFEMKTTNLWYDTKSKGRFNPEDMSDWITRSTAYAAAYGKEVAHITVVFMNGQNGMEMHTWTLEFSDTDLKDAKTDVEARRDDLDAYDRAYKSRNVLPPVTKRAYERECSFCHHMKGCLPELLEAGLPVESRR